MYYIIGLGNPGRRFRMTRHNIGFWVVDSLAEEHHLKWKAGSGEFLLASHPRGTFSLVKPLTYMNNSGRAFRQLRQSAEFRLEETLVIYDDLDLPLGRLRFRPGGSAGTHRGIQSIVEKAGTDQVPRLRLGIGIPEQTGPAEEFVLQPFSDQELPVARDVVATAVDGVKMFIHEGIEAAMNTFNQIDRSH